MGPADREVTMNTTATATSPLGTDIHAYPISRANITGTAMRVDDASEIAAIFDALYGETVSVSRWARLEQSVIGDRDGVSITYRDIFTAPITGTVDDVLEVQCNAVTVVIGGRRIHLGGVHPVGSADDFTLYVH
jgi:hypothetical protein